jgi:Concanavalin A-like lectin/glucanases superfamily/Bacterial Ig domain/Bacterial cadherin-like domain/Cadherin-like domain/RTX calcium-binding nonapeptide repeat (4 copies)
LDLPEKDIGNLTLGREATMTVSQAQTQKAEPENTTVKPAITSDWSAQVRGIQGNVLAIAEGEQHLLEVGDTVQLHQTVLSVADSAVVFQTEFGEVISIGFDQKVSLTPQWLEGLVANEDALFIPNIENLEQLLASGKSLEESLPAPAAGGPTTTVTSAGDNPARVDRIQQTTAGVSSNEFGTQSLTVSVGTDTDGDIVDVITNDVQSDGAAPIAVADVVVTQEDQTLVTANLLLNDSLPDLSSVTDFDAFSIEGATISYNGDGTFTYQPTANFFGTDSFSYTLIDFNGQSSTAVVTVNVTAVNDTPTVAAVVSLTAGEDTIDTSLDLLANASDVDTADTLSVSNLTETSGNDAAGVSFVDNRLVVADGHYNYLAQGEVLELNYIYDVVDGNGGIVSTSASVTIIGANDAPVVSATIDESQGEDATGVTIDLLQNSSDIDISDSLSISDLIEISGEDAGGLALVGKNLVVTDGYYNYLAAGENLTLTYTYSVIDDNGGITPTSVAITINGSNDIPAVSAAVSLVTNEDAAATLDLLANATDEDTTDVLAVAHLVETSGRDAGGISLVDNNLVIADGYYDYLTQGQTLVLNYTYDVSDGNGGVVATSASITINGTNDAPEVKADIDGLQLSVGSASGNVVFNDSDVDNPAGDLSVVTPAYIVGKYGNLLLNEDGSFDYQLANSGGSIITGPTNNLVTYWNADNNTEDVAPAGAVSDSLTLRNGASYSANGRVGQALAFDGVNDYVSVANSADINSAPGDFVQRSISLWFKADDASGRQVIFEEGGNINGLNIYVENGQVFVGGWSTSEGHGWAGTWHSAAVTDGQWHHVTLVLDTSANGANTTAPNSFFAYLDGQDISGVDTSASELYRGHTGDINVGRSGGSIRYDDGNGGYESDGSANYFAGEVDDVRIYDGALSAAEVDELANPPIVIDNSGGTQVDPSDVLQGEGPTDGLVTRWQMDDATDSAVAGAKADTLNFNGAQITVDASLGNVLEFSGAQIAEPGDSADINIGTFSERTVSFWFNADDTSGRQVIYKEGGSVRGLNIYIDDGELYVSGWNTPGGESGWSGSFVSSATIVAGQWHQVSLVLDGGTSVTADALSMYLDGQLVGQTSGSQLWSHSGDINLGGSDTTVYYHDGFSNAKNYFDGKLDDGRIYNKALDANEAAELHNPSSDAVVIDTFEYQITDGQDSSDTTDIKFVVTDRNLVEGDNVDNNLLGGAGDDVIFGRQGSDTATGGAGSDTYVWVDGDQSSAVVPVDVISDFQRGTDGDLLDLRDLLQGENVANVTDYLQFESDGTDTVVSIDSKGNAGASVDQQIVLEGVDLTLLGNNQAIANQLLGDGNLHIDT